MSCMMSGLVQQCSSISNPAARMLRAAIFNSRFKCSSGACVEIEGVMEVSEISKVHKLQKYSSSTYVCC